MVTRFNTAEVDQQEALQYRPGQRVELKQCPGVVDTIAEYDPMMVPPIWLVNDPKPHYPEELTLLVKPMLNVEWFRPAARRKAQSSAPSCLLAQR
jgi:hypothetical protein